MNQITSTRPGGKHFRKLKHRRSFGDAGDPVARARIEGGSLTPPANPPEVKEPAHSRRGHSASALLATRAEPISLEATWCTLGAAAGRALARIDRERASPEGRS